MSVRQQCERIITHLRAEGYGDDSDIPEQHVILAIDAVVGGSKVTIVRYLDDYLTEKYGCLYIKSDARSTYRFVIPRSERQAQHRKDAQDSMKSGVV